MVHLLREAIIHHVFGVVTYRLLCIQGTDFCVFTVLAYLAAFNIAIPHGDNAMRKTALQSMSTRGA